MVRVARGDDGTLVPSRTAPGRGAWVCSAACLDLAAKRKGFDRAYRTAVPPGAISALREAIAASTDRMNDAVQDDVHMGHGKG